MHPSIILPYPSHLDQLMRYDTAEPPAHMSQLEHINKDTCFDFEDLEKLR